MPIGIGFHEDNFTIGLTMIFGEAEFDAAIAVDEIQFVDCGWPFPMADCQQGQFQCGASRACVEVSLKMSLNHVKNIFSCP